MRPQVSRKALGLDRHIAEKEEVPNSQLLLDKYAVLRVQNTCCHSEVDPCPSPYEFLLTCLDYLLYPLQMEISSNLRNRGYRG